MIVWPVRLVLPLLVGFAVLGVGCTGESMPSGEGAGAASVTTDEQLPTQPSVTDSIPVPRQSEIGVELFLVSEDRASSWVRSLSIGYGADPQMVSIEPTGDSGGGSFLGPELAVPAGEDTWWVIDTFGERVALFETTENAEPQLKVSVAVESEDLVRIQSGFASAEGDLIARSVGGAEFVATGSGEFLANGYASPPYASPVSWTVLDSGQTLSVASRRCGSFFIKTDLSSLGFADRNPASGADVYCDGAGRLHVLWYVFDQVNREAANSYILIDQFGKMLVNEPMGDVDGLFDPTQLAQLQIVPSSNAPALSVTGVDGLEGWVRTQASLGE